MEELLENEAFFDGVVAGISIYQQKVITAHERKEPIKVGEELFYIYNGRERLQEVIDKICK